MKPILFPSTATEFTTQGLGALSDAISCIVTEERNGLYELEMQYPQSGIHFSEIQNRCIVYAIPSPYREAQPFRVYRITRPINGIATIYAQHISYDLAGIPVNPFAAGSAAEALSGMASHTAVESPFSFWTDKSTTANFSVLVPSASRSVLGGVEGSILDVYGGEYLFDKFLVRLYNQRGNDNGVVIRYGKNLTDVEQDANISSVATGVLPYWVGAEGEVVQGNIVNADGTFDFVRIMTIDFSSDFENQPTASELETRALQYIKSNKIGVPSVSISVSFVQLEQTEEYKDLALLEKCDLCDTVTVQFEALGINAKAEIVRIITDVLLERYESVEVGDIRANIAYTIADQQQKIEKAPTTSAMQQAINNATNQITGNKGGYVILHSSTGSKEPDEILIMDTPDISTATKVWRWNKSGLGYSSSGYNGPYGLAMTQDGAIVADFITTGVLTANLIKAGVLQSLNGASSINMETGEASLTGSITTASGGFQVTLGNSSISFYFNGVKVGDLSQVTYGNQKDLQINASRAVFSGRNLSEVSQVQIGTSSTYDSANYFAYPFIIARKGTGLSCSFSVQPNSNRTEMVLELNGTEYGKKTATIDGQTITYLGPI